MDPERFPPDAGYPVSCHQCQGAFDAQTAESCQCLVGRRTVVCPHCGSCFCRAKPAYKQKFWERAPQSMWDRALAERKALVQPPPNPAPDKVVRPLVLVVDDEKDIQQMTAIAIADLGYGVVLARDGKEGLELARRYRPDLILTDAFMPKLDGREMCRQIKENPLLASIPVVVMTAVYTSARYRSEAFKEFRADDYLSKPLDFPQLRSVLHKHIAPGKSGG